MPAAVVPTDPRLNAYASIDNVARAQSVQTGRLLKTRAHLQGKSTQDSTSKPGLSVIILTLDKPELIIPLVESLKACGDPFRKAGLGFEVLIGDTGSTDPKVLALYDNVPEWVRVTRNLTYQFSRSNNDVFYGSSQYDTTLFLNNDVILKETPNALWQMYEALTQDPSLGAVGPVMFFEEGTVQHAGVDVFRNGPLAGFCFHPHSRQDLPALRQDRWTCPAVTGACLMMKSDIFHAAGGFDEGYETEAQDVALCLAARRLGYEVQVLDLGRILHLENATRLSGSEDWADRQRFMRRWGGFIAAHYL